MRRRTGRVVGGQPILAVATDLIRSPQQHVLDRALAAADAALRADADKLLAAVDWADLNPHPDGILTPLSEEPVVLHSNELANWTPPGTPRIDPAATAEFGLAVGVSDFAAAHYLRRALILRARLPRLWDAVHRLDIAAWRALAAAEESAFLTPAGVAWLDRQLAIVGGRISRREIDKLVVEADLLFPWPNRVAVAADGDADDPRYFTVSHDETGMAGGWSHVSGLLSPNDAADLDRAVAAGAAGLAEWGCTASEDVRRSMAVGDLARRQTGFSSVGTSGSAPPGPTETVGSAVDRRTHEATPSSQDDLDGSLPREPTTRRDIPTSRDTGVPPDGPPPWFDTGPAPPTPRPITLYLHLSDAALTEPAVADAPLGGDPPARHVGRFGNAGIPVTAETIRTWCGSSGVKVTVRPSSICATRSP